VSLGIDNQTDEQGPPDAKEDAANLNKPSS
jgi:hypothetical protein